MIFLSVVVNKSLKKQVPECTAVRLIYTPGETGKSLMMKQSSFLLKLLTGMLTGKRELKADGCEESWQVQRNVLSIDQLAWKASMAAPSLSCDAERPSWTCDVDAVRLLTLMSSSSSVSRCDAAGRAAAALIILMVPRGASSRRLPVSSLRLP